MVVIMGVMIVGGIFLWLTRGEFHMMPMHGGHGGGNAHVREDAGAMAGHAEGAGGDAQDPADGDHHVDKVRDSDPTSPPGTPPDGMKH